MSTNVITDDGAEKTDVSTVVDQPMVDAVIAEQNAAFRAKLDTMFPSGPRNGPPAGWGGGKFSGGRAQGFGC